MSEPPECGPAAVTNAPLTTSASASGTRRVREQAHPARERRAPAAADEPLGADADDDSERDGRE